MPSLTEISGPTAVTSSSSDIEFFFLLVEVSMRSELQYSGLRRCGNCDPRCHENCLLRKGFHDALG